MPKVTGPIFSLTANGTLGGLITYKNNMRAQIAKANRWAQVTRTTKQSAQRNKFATARAQYDALDSPTKAKWMQLAINQNLQAFNLYLREYCTQAVIAPDAPRLPNNQGA
ncbi:MAG: hypothetical protein ABIN25_14150 [Ginsengibacter sp.]